MEAGTVVRPDTAFVARLMRAGGGDLKRCFQCGTCSVSCTLSPEASPFPRTQMLHAGWGLKERLMADPAVWLCHDCGDCTERCPRGARPGDVLAAVRAEAIRHFAVPGWLAGLATSPAGLPWLLLLPVVVLAAVAAWSAPEPGVGAFEFASFFPVPTLEMLFFTVAGLSLLAFAAGLYRFVAAMAPEHRSRLLANLPATLLLVARHGDFCETRPTLHWGHLLTFWGFVGLAAVGTAVGVGTLLGVMRTPLPLLSAWKVAANVFAVALLAGLSILLARRLGDPARRAHTTYGDWLFLSTLLGVVATGLASEALRLSQALAAMRAVYFVHLVLIFALFLYAPYFKFAHLAYRTAAMAAAGGARR